MKPFTYAVSALMLAATPASAETWELDGFGGAASPGVFLLDTDSITAPTATTRDATILFVQVKDDPDGTAALAFAVTFDCAAQTIRFRGRRNLNAAGAQIGTAPGSPGVVAAADGTPLGGIGERACTGAANGHPAIKGPPPIGPARASAATHYARPAN